MGVYTWQTRLVIDHVERVFQMRMGIFGEIRYSKLQTAENSPLIHYLRLLHLIGFKGHIFRLWWP